MTDGALVLVNHLTKTFKGESAPALNDITLDVKKGEMAALVGPDGAGKTTFLRILCGLMLSDRDLAASRADSGVKGCQTVLIDGFCPVKDLAYVKQKIGYMPQKFGLYEDLSVIENLNLYAALNFDPKKDKSEAAAEIETLLRFAGLSEFKKRLAGDLSGGMKQKLGLCCTLISKPALLLLDEPSVGVDPLSRRELMKIVQKLVKENGITVIWSTSYLDEAEKFERVFVFSDGTKIFDGNPKEAIKAAGLGPDVDIRFEDAVISMLEGDKHSDENCAGEKSSAEKPSGEGLADISNVSVLGGDETLKAALGRQGAALEGDVTICAKGLTKIYKNKGKEFKAASDISFDIKKGEIFGLLGPNGAGKSTTFKMLCGLIRPTEGYSSIMGIRMNENPSLARSYLGYAAQKFSLFGDLSVIQNLNFFGGVYGLTGMARKRRIESLLNYFDLKKYRNFDAKSLPLGFKQRLALSCAIIHNPPVLFLDEPTSGVDPLSRREFWEQIKTLAGSGTTVLVTTHFMDEALFCNRISLIYKGKSLVTAPPDELKSLVRSADNPNPTMEDAFIELILREEKGEK